MRTEDDGVPTEAKLTQGLSHPCIVRLHAHKLVKDTRQPCMDGYPARAGGPVSTDELWLILEYCDKGSVQVPTPLKPTSAAMACRKVAVGVMSCCKCLQASMKTLATQRLHSLLGSLSG